MDAVAGGGGIITLPAYLFAGVPIHVAYGTNKFGNSFGTAIATFNYGRGGFVRWKPGFLCAVFSLIGSWLGARLVVALSDHEAIDEMVRQTGPYRLDEQGMLVSGVLIRHLVLPGQVENTKGVIDWVADHFPAGTVLFSLMSQYVPCGRAANFPEINRPLRQKEYDTVEQYLFDKGIEDGFLQELSSADKGFIPAFDLTGVFPQQKA